VKKKLKIG